MSAAAVMFDGVWKKFRRGERHNSLRDLLPSVMKRVVRPKRSVELLDEEFWAVRDVSFELNRGEALGIIGPNGAGKSTTLKLLNRILRPTRGRCEIRGRIGALIEVSAGFHPDLTGRENIYLQGAILGMKRIEIERHFAQIVEFAGIGRFLDTPVKRYSSGMHARLGFAIAAHLNPDVLIIDEVLSVGDMEFQRRCNDRMLELRDSGVSLLLVSHNLSAIRALCTRTLLLRQGSAVFLGGTDAALRHYVQIAGKRDGACAQVDSIQVSGVNLPQGADPMRLHPGDPLLVRLRAAPNQIPADGLLVTYVTEQQTGMVAHNSNIRINLPPGYIAPDQEIELCVRMTLNLLRGTYAFKFSIFDPASQSHAWTPTPVLIGIDELASYEGVAHLEPSVSASALECAGLASTMLEDQAV